VTYFLTLVALTLPPPGVRRRGLASLIAVTGKMSFPIAVVADHFLGGLAGKLFHLRDKLFH
jgi:hypothetical protein